jgi:hypothetical protein
MCRKVYNLKQDGFSLQVFAGLGLLFKLLSVRKFLDLEKCGQVT